MCKIGTITLNQYRKEVEKIQELVFDIFKEDCEDSVYEVVLNFRDTADLVGYGIYTRVLKQFSSVERYIQKECRYFDDEEEPARNRFYWAVTKSRLINGEYVEGIRCCFSVCGKLLSVHLPVLLERLHHGERLSFFERDFLTFPPNVAVPYQTGDILKINAQPFAKPLYAIYCGDKGDKRSKRLWHWCLYESEDHKGLWISDLSANHFTDYAYFEQSPLTLCEPAPDCPDEKLQRVSAMLKANPDIWQEWLCYTDRNEDLESYIFKEERE